jgi:flagellar basal body-associated protein FliL
LWWLWIIIIIILLIVIAAIVWWIRQKQQNAGDEEDPKLEATQDHAAQNADDEFEIEQETPKEDTPMLNNGEQQSSS